MEQEIMAYDEARYIDCAGYGASQTDIQLLNVGFTKFDEQSNPTEKSTQYVGDKSKTNRVTGYDNQFDVDFDRVKNNSVNDYCYDIFVNRKTGTDAETYLYIVDLSSETTTNTYSARKLRVSVVVSSATNNPGESKTCSGSLKGVGDFVYGTFNTSTKTFTETV